MTYNFNEEDKQVKKFSERIGFGIHKVQLVGAEAGTNNEGKDFVAVTVVSEDGIEEEVRLWFVGGAANISFNTLRQILVHSVDTDEKKQTVRDGVDAASNADELATMLNKAAGSELWLTKYLDPKRTYQNAQGQIRPSINTNIMGYEPKLKPELMPRTDTRIVDAQAAFPGAQEVPFESKSDAPGSTVPAKDAWAK